MKHRILSLLLLSISSQFALANEWDWKRETYAFNVDKIEWSSSNGTGVLEYKSTTSNQQDTLVNNETGATYYNVSQGSSHPFFRTCVFNESGDWVGESSGYSSVSASRRASMDYNPLTRRKELYSSSSSGRGKGRRTVQVSTVIDHNEDNLQIYSFRIATVIGFQANKTDTSETLYSYEYNDLGELTVIKAVENGLINYKDYSYSTDGEYQCATVTQRPAEGDSIAAKIISKTFTNVSNDTIVEWYDTANGLIKIVLKQAIVMV